MAAVAISSNVASLGANIAIIGVNIGLMKESSAALESSVMNQKIDDLKQSLDALKQCLVTARKQQPIETTTTTSNEKEKLVDTAQATQLSTKKEEPKQELKTKTAREIYEEECIEEIRSAAQYAADKQASAVRTSANRDCSWWKYDGWGVVYGKGAKWLRDGNYVPGIQTIRWSSLSGDRDDDDEYGVRFTNR